jgi:uncharacterized NAD(P)/FAD-binding protein YdhS
MLSNGVEPHADIAIVGNGASGVLLAAQLVRHGQRRIALIGRGDPPGLGVAYSTQCRGHLLNVRASDMSALDDEPGHFVHWLARDGNSLGRNDFVPRADYGRYLRDLLADSVRRAEGRLQIIAGEVTALREQSPPPALRATSPENGGGEEHRTPPPRAGEVARSGGGGVEIDIDGHHALRARKAVLATGHRPPSEDTGAWRGNPWREDAIADLAPDAAVLLIGTSLTMIDVLISLLERGHAGPIVALSRRGLVPHCHPWAPIPSADIDTQAFSSGPLSQRTRLFRSKVRNGLAWAGLMQLLRPSNNELWQGLDLDQRRRFLRHLRPWWDAHRHRVAPQIGEIIEAARARGQLSIRAAKFEIGRIGDRGVDVSIVPRGSTVREQHSFDRVVDCRGPRNEADVKVPLHAQMAEDGLLRSDPLGQGLDVSADEALIATDGRPSRHLFVLGPPTRGRYTEIVAIPDIRIQAAAVARQLIAGLEAPSGLVGRPAA